MNGSDKLLSIAMQRLVNQARQKAFLDALMHFLEASWEQDFHTADLFGALSAYSARERDLGSEQTRQTWDTVAILMQIAAQEAR